MRMHSLCTKRMRSPFVMQVETVARLPGWGEYKRAEGGVGGSVGRRPGRPRAGQQEEDVVGKREGASNWGPMLEDPWLALPL